MVPFHLLACLRLFVFRSAVAPCCMQIGVLVLLKRSIRMLIVLTCRVVLICSVRPLLGCFFFLSCSILWVSVAHFAVVVILS